MRAQLLAAPDRPVVRVCRGPGCLAQGADKVSQAFKAAIQEHNIPADVKPLIKETGCHGFCSQGTLVNLYPPDLFYVQVKPADVPRSWTRHSVAKARWWNACSTRDNGNRYKSAAEVPFYKLQQKIILKNVGLIDPLNIEDALKAGAYHSLAKALTQMTPDEIIETVTVAGLRGRGGGGFPTGYKWRKAVENARDNPGPVFIVANGDEGDPGAFMDRAIMEGDPHAVLEGMAIGARAMGAEQGYLYVRAEYPFAIRHLSISPSSRPGPWDSWAGISWERGSISMSRSTAAPAPLSAAKRRPSWPPSRAGSANPSPGRPTRWKKAYGTAPR